MVRCPLAGLAVMTLVTGCGADDDEVEPGPSAASGATAGAVVPASNVPVATVATGAVGVVRLIVTPVPGTTPDELAAQLAAQFGGDVAVVRTLREHLVVTVPNDRRAELEQAAAVAHVQDDGPEPAGG